MGDTFKFLADPFGAGVKDASKRAREYEQAGIEEQRRIYGITEANLQPFLRASEAAMPMQTALSGAEGQAAREQALEQLRSSPQFQQAVAAGEQALLDTAQATGGPRGGDPSRTLATTVNRALGTEAGRTYGYLGDLTTGGVNTALQLGSLGAQMAAGVGQGTANIENIRQAQRLAERTALYNLVGSGAQLGGYLYGTQGQGGLGGGVPINQDLAIETGTITPDYTGF